jgi:Rrf2 family protein
MKLSTKGRYGLRAVIDIALNDGMNAVSISSIAQRQSLSESYLEQLMRKLRNAGIIRSVRGASGGYTLAKPPDKISVGDILRALEGDLEPVNCPAISRESGLCASQDCCVTKNVWKRINDSVNEAVDGILLSVLIEESRQNPESNTNCEL